MRLMDSFKNTGQSPSPRDKFTRCLLTFLVAGAAAPNMLLAADAIPAPGSKLPAMEGNKVITAADVTAEKVGTTIPVSAIGEPVSAVNLSAPRWVNGANGGYGVVDGQMLPVDPKGKPINFRVCLPANWTRRGAQMGGSGFNGTIPSLTGSELSRGFATYGSDSGHQAGGFGGGRFPGMVVGRGGTDIGEGGGRGLVASTPIPNQYDKQGLLIAWVEQNKMPGKTLKLTAGNRSQLLCSYPNFPKYVSGPPESADSYASTAP
jgi:hypothetical protein